MLTRCEQIMSEICTNFEAELREFAGAHDLLLVPSVAAPFEFGSQQPSTKRRAPGLMCSPR